MNRRHQTSPPAFAPWIGPAVSHQTDCRRCGNCCQHVIPVLPEELKRIANFLPIKNPRDLKDPDFYDPALAFPATGQQERCCLLTVDGLCSVHPVKPQVCQSSGCTAQNPLPIRA